MRRSTLSGERPSGRATPMTLLVAGGLWAAHALAGCMPESIAVGAMDGGGGELGLGGEGGEGDVAQGAGGRSVQGGGPSGGRSGGSGGRTPLAGNAGQSSGAFGNAAAEGGEPGMGGFAGSAAGFGQGGFGGSFAGFAGDLPIAGSFGFSGSAGDGGTGGTGWGEAGSGNTGGVFGYAGGTAGSDELELPAAETAPCAEALCEGSFGWRPALAADAEYFVTDLSGDGLLLIGYGAQGRGYRLSWDRARMWMLVESSGGFPAEASTFGGALLVGANRWVLQNGVPEPFAGIPDDYTAVGLSNDGEVMTAVQEATGSYLYRSGNVTELAGYVLWAVSGSGTTLAGERLADGRAVLGNLEGDWEAVPLNEDWIPRMVSALSEDGSVAAGEATSAADSSVVQAFRWQRGSSELELLGVPAGATASRARDCNFDCSIVVGVASNASGPTDGFVYQDKSGISSVSSYATRRAGLATVSGFAVDSLFVSYDGTRIAGGGTKDGTRVAFEQRFWSLEPSK